MCYCCLTENWTLVQMIGEISDSRDVLNWLAKQRLINNCIYGTSEHLFETYLVEYVAYTHPLFSIFFHTCIHRRAVSYKHLTCGIQT